jgi:protocatechuate 3,4-dioxygenase beta subunit
VTKYVFYKKKEYDMKSLKTISYILGFAFLSALMVNSTAFSASKGGMERNQFKQHMHVALSLWLNQQQAFKVHTNDQKGSQDTYGDNNVTGTASIEGRVTGSDGAPLEAFVLAWSTDDGKLISGSAVTDDSGRYEITALSAGKYYVAAAGNGYEAQLYDHTSSLHHAATVKLDDSEAASGIDFSLTALPSMSGTGSIAGTVLNQADNQPIAGAWILAVAKNNMMMFYTYFATSGTDGSYNLLGLAPGKYVLFVQAQNFVAEFYNDKSSPLDADAVQVAADQSVTGIDVLLAEGGTISGVVTDSTGTGILGVSVTAAPESQSGWEHWLLSPAWLVATTNDSGAYSIPDLAAGSYIVSAVLHSTDGTLVQWWENASRERDATPVQVTSGIETASINFAFASLKANGAIAGTITDVDQTPLPDILVVVWNKSSKPSSHFHKGGSSTAKTDSSGNYLISELQPGNYLVSATRLDWWNYQTIWYDSASTSAKATPVTVKNDSTSSEIDFAFPRARQLGSISGTVVSDSGGTAIANALIQASQVSGSKRSNCRQRPTSIARTDENGNYTLSDLLEGDYRLSVRFDGFSEFYDNVQDKDDAMPVTVVGGDTTAGINFGIPISPGESSIAGTVTDDSTDLPIVGAVIGVFPSFNSWSQHPGWHHYKLFYAVTSDSSGNYSVGGLPAGSYVVSSWARGYIAEYYDNHTNPRDADIITLDGVVDTSGIDFALIPGRKFDFDDQADNGELGSISGLVTSPEGQAVEGTYVYAMDADRVMRASEATGPDGQYTLGGLPEGQYYLVASRMPYKINYYNQASSAANASAVAIDAATLDVSSVNFQLSDDQATSSNQGPNEGVPADYALAQNYPNPFNPTTTISYSLPEAGKVRLLIYNLRGELVRTLVDGHQSASSYQIVWNGEDRLGQIVPSGIYLYRLQAGNFSQIRRMVLLK